MHVCLQAVAFGMGGGLLQKVNRDTLSFATKLSHIVYADGTPADIMKAPVGDSAKISFPGENLCETVVALHATTPCGQGTPSSHGGRGFYILVRY